MSKSEEREKRQIKVFTKWVNSYLRKKGIKVESLSECFKDGVNLCYLYEIIADEKLPKYIENPKNMIQKTNNLAIVLKKINSFVDEVGIKLQYSPQQIANGDARSTLGMLWILITKFVIPESEESLSRKRSLLRWVQRVTEPYKNVDVKNFTRSWSDGLAFNALLDQFDNTLMDYDALTPEDPAHNCENAFAVAEKLGIYRLLDVSDITEMDPPDEKSVMTYVSTMYQFFHSQAGRKLEQDAKQLVVDIGRMLQWVRESNEKHQIPEEWVSDELELEKQLEECRSLEQDLHGFNAEKSKMANIKTMMYLKLAKIQRIQRNERIKVYTPPEDQNMTVLQTEWEGMNNTVIAYSEALRNKILEIEEALRKRAEDWIALKEKNANEKREAEKKIIDDEIKRRDIEEDTREKAERKKRDEWIAFKEQQADEKRSQESERLSDEIKKREEEDSARREEERKRREAIIKEEEERRSKEMVESRKEKEESLKQQAAEEAERLKKLRLAQDDYIEEFQAKEFAKMEEERAKKEKEIQEKEEEERNARNEERQKVLEAKREKEAGEREKLKEYDTLASEFMTWLNNTQTELTHTETLAEDEEDEETDEETRNKRKEAAEEVQEKIKPLLEKWEVLEQEKLSEWASIPINECSYAKDTMLFALIGEENKTLSEISKFKFPEDEKKE